MQSEALRRIVTGIGIAVLSCFPATAGDDAVAQLTLERVCGSGFQGELTVIWDAQGESRVRFHACPSPTGCSVWLENASGLRLVQVESSDTEVRVRLAGVDPRTATVEDIRDVRALLDSPEAEAARRLPRELLELGMRPDAPSMRCLAMASQALEKP